MSVPASLDTPASGPASPLERASDAAARLASLALASGDEGASVELPASLGLAPASLPDATEASPPSSAFAASLAPAWDAGDPHATNANAPPPGPAPETPPP